MRMKSWVYIVLTVLLAVTTAGCSSKSGGADRSASGTDGSTNSKEKITLTLWYWNNSIDDNLIKQASTQFPNIKLNAQKIGGDFRAKLLTALSAGSGAPDITGLNSDIATYFPSKEKFVNLLDLGADKYKSDYLEWKWQLAITGDNKYMVGFPMDTGPTALYYRSDLFKEAGLPSEPEEVAAQIKTWDDYMNAGKKLRDATGGKVFLTDNLGNVFNQYMAQQEKYYFDNQDNFIGDGPHVKEAWNLAATFNKENLVAKIGGGTPEWNAAMANGKIASFVGAVWMSNILEQAAPDTKGKWRVAPAPGGAGNDGGSFLAIPKQSKHPKEAFEVITWLQNAQNQTNSFATIDLFPATPASYEDPKMQQANDFYGGQITGKVFIESAQKVKPKYLGAYANVVGAPFTTELTNIEKSGKDPEKAYADALADAKKKLQQAK